MKSFIIVEKADKTALAREGNIDFVPAFPGIYIDLDKETDSESCDHYLGITGLGCEYHLKEGQIKKMFLEMKPFELVEFVPENAVELIKNQLKGEIVPHEVVSFKNAKCFSPKKILLGEEFDLVQFFFSIPKVGKSFEWAIESLHYIKVSSNVAFGLTEKNELASIIVADFAKRIYDNDLILESDIEGSVGRFKKFVRLNQQFYDKNIGGDDYEALVKKYLAQYNPSDKNLIHSTSTDAKILARLVNEKKWFQKLLKK